MLGALVVPAKEGMDPGFRRGDERGVVSMAYVAAAGV